MSVQRLCEGCPLRDSQIASTYDRILEDAAYEVNSTEDRARIEAQPNADELLAALGQQGTQRCVQLARHLPPPPRRRKRAVQAMACPEFRLMSYLVQPGDGEVD
jgi:hypothetical protein